MKRGERIAGIAANLALFAGLAAMAVSVGTVAVAVALASTPDPYCPPSTALREIGWPMGGALRLDEPTHPRATLTIIGAPTLKRVLRRHDDRLLACYERALSRRPHIEGGVTAEFTIGFDGRVYRAHAAGFERNVAECVAQEIAALSFPHADEDLVDVRATFEFRLGRR